MKGYIYGNEIVIKPGRIPHFYASGPLSSRPRNMHQYRNHYTYEYVEGRHANDGDLKGILNFFEKNVWFKRGDHIDPKVVSNYVDYIKSHELIPGSSCSVYIVRLACAILKDFGRRGLLPMVANVHGDLTFENIIVRKDGSYCIIDPGDSRGVWTPSLDKGKLLQSYVMRWEERTNPIYQGDKCTWGPWETNPGPWPVWATIIDWAFLVTHWVRLTKHWPDLPTETGFEILRKVKPE